MYYQNNKFIQREEYRRIRRRELFEATLSLLSVVGMIMLAIAGMIIGMN